MVNNKISIVLLSYNPVWEKMKGTLMSILMQEDIEIELIVADDGSQTRYDEEILCVCKQYDFENVKFANQKTNSGTCANILNALSMATAPYVKLISAGDFLFDKQTCNSWVKFMNKTKADVTFGDAVYYCEEKGRYRLTQQKKAPVQEKLFSGNKRRALFVDYLLANDTILGATVMYKTEIIKKYMELFKGKVKFAEDYAIRFAIFENKKVIHFSQNTIWYEFGSGISTSKNKKWKELLYHDFVSSNEIIRNACTAKDKIANKYQKFLKKEIKNSMLHKIKKCLCFPDVVYWRFRNRKSTNLTDINADLEKLYLFLDKNAVKNKNEVQNASN